MQEGSEKKMFMLTATPINNSFLDLQHLIELFTHRKDDYFAAAPLGIHSLTGHFRKMEKQLDSFSDGEICDLKSLPDSVIKSDRLINELVVQRSRSYVKRSLNTEDNEKVIFSLRQPRLV